MAIAERAGDALLELRARRPRPDDVGVVGDRTANELILEAIRAEFPSDAILSEESTDDLARLKAERLWIVDPLDGSREFSEDRDDWAVHVAFVYRNKLAGGAVALPARGLTLSTLAASPAPAPSGQLRMVVSRTRPPRVAQLVAKQFGAQLIPLGSAGAKTSAVVLGEADIYLHAGGQHEWDLAAPAAVALAAGLHVSRIDGSQLRFNQPDAWLPDVLVCPANLATGLLEAVRQAWDA